jgi:hypothetical protein
MGIGTGQGSHGTRLLEHEDSLRQLAPSLLLDLERARARAIQWSGVRYAYAVAREVGGGVRRLVRFKWQRKLKRGRRGEARRRPPAPSRGTGRGSYVGGQGIPPSTCRCPPAAPGSVRCGCACARRLPARGSTARVLGERGETAGAGKGSASGRCRPKNVTARGA